ncbi:MAG TPA: HAMP domain-containing methyl-accepting chemotaxis protein [Geobacteraceae bacterium]|nr:HAMP domain-containing methyl-accepting chemotaxis protein [Geobacteraceae bacterium]
MYVRIVYKLILGFAVVIAAVRFAPDLVTRLGYSPEMTIVFTYGVAITVGLILGWLFSGRFTKNITLLTTTAESISKGDLTTGISINRPLFPDETNDLAASINQMRENLRDLVGFLGGTSGKISESATTLSSSALEINASAEEVAQAIEQISRGAETQAEMVGRSSKIIHEMAISVELVAKRAKEAARAARETSITAQKGGELANDSLERMKSFFDMVDLTGRQFTEFNAKVQQVGKIADFIGEIARQTNLLALNASIEAARAGEFGKGFAVVADEVRKLADGTAKSASDIIDLISEIKEQSGKVHASIAESSKQINVGKMNLDITATSFRDILSTVLDTEHKANSIADLSQMQTEGAGKMVQAIDEIAKVTEDNAASTEEVSAASEEQSTAMQEMVHATKELTTLAGELLRIVERFTIERNGQAEQ